MRLTGRLALISVLVLLLVCVALYFLILSEAVNERAATAAGTVGAALFAALAAYAAMTAAQRSDETARRSSEALGRTINPDIDVQLMHVEDGSVDQLYVRNGSEHEARDVRVRIALGDRVSGWHHFGDLARFMDPNRLWHDSVSLPPGDWRGPGRQEIRVQYSDSLGLLRWETRKLGGYDVAADGGQTILDQSLISRIIARGAGSDAS